MSRALAEVVIESPADAVAAQAGGADRLELCVELHCGGLSPDAELLRATRAATDLPVAVLVRSRPGDFVFARHEVDTMVVQAEELRAAGAAALVFGAATPAGMPDADAVRRLRTVCGERDEEGSAELVFHRAFDGLRDQRAALHLLAALDVDRILTSGHPKGCAHGVDALTALVAEAGDALTVMPGGGVRPELLRPLVEQVGAREVHFSAREVPTDPTDELRVRAFVERLELLGELFD